MADYDNRIWTGAAGTAAIDTGLRAHMLKVYNYMTGALVRPFDTVLSHTLEKLDHKMPVVVTTWL